MRRIVGPEWLTADQVARVLGITASAVRWRARKGTLASVVTARGERRFRRSHVEAVLNSGGSSKP